MSTATQTSPEGELRQRQRQTDPSLLDPSSTDSPATGVSTPDSRKDNAFDTKDKKTYGRTPDGTGTSTFRYHSSLYTQLTKAPSFSLHCTYDT